MIISSLRIFIVSFMLFSTLIQGCSEAAKDVERPEKIVSKRIIVYDTETYQGLARLWKQYYDAFPSEDAYANWMYAARYGGDPDYEKLLEKGYKRYPANPTILYLYGMKKYGCHDDLEGQYLMEKAARLDPTYMDPWFGLVGYYLDQDEEKLDVALRRLLEGNAIGDVVMDYNYNILASLDRDAILVTNGDMDTYPGWILKRILKFRPDVIIVNRSLLNTDWYPLMLMKEGLPKFVTRDGLEELREEVMAGYKERGDTVPPQGPYSDTLLVRLINTATRESRPVYIAATVYSCDVVERYREQGRNYGLTNLVTPTDEKYSDQLKKFLRTWQDDFKTAGLDSWSFRHSKEGVFMRHLAVNYASSLNYLMDDIKKYVPEDRLGLFHWYQRHLLEQLPEKHVDEIGRMWCNSDDIKEIENWCRRQGYLE